MVQRATDPYYQFIVMNRLSTKNFVEDITPGFELQVSDPFILYRNRLGEINGIWIFDAAERDAICRSVKR